MKKSTKTVKKAREKGIPVPKKTIGEAITYIKLIYDARGQRLMSFNEMAEYMQVSGGWRSTIFSLLENYGLIEQTKTGLWKVTDDGVKCLNNDYNSVKDAFEKVPIFKKLMNVFGDKDVTQRAIVDYLKTLYKKPDKYVKNAAEKFWYGKEYLDSIQKGEEPRPPKLSINHSITEKWLYMIKLKYALSPPSQSEKKEIIIDLLERVKDDKDLRIFAESLKENVANDDSIKTIFNLMIKT